MKNLTAKRLFAILLSALLLCSALSPMVYAGERKIILGEVTPTYPTIYIHGFASSTIYANLGQEDQYTVWPMETDLIMNVVTDAIPKLAAGLLPGNYAMFEDALVEAVNLIFDGSCNNPDGTTRTNVGVDFTYPTEIAPTDTVRFEYDWRSDPLAVARDLNDFIDYVLEKTGSDKVAIECHSMGGIILVSYIAQFGDEKIHGAVLDTTALYGASYIEPLFSNQVVIDGEAVYAYIRGFMKGTDYEDILNWIFDSLFAAGIFDAIELVGEELINRSLNRIAIDCLIPVFAYWPSIWAMLPAEYFEECESFIFDTVLTADDDAEKLLRETVNRYAQTVYPVMDSILENLMAKGHSMVISRYGLPMPPVCDQWNSMSDTVIDTKYSSYGATTSNYGEKLTEEYVLANKDKGYLSPDNMVDASTCKFPNNTWFIKDLQHSNGTDAMDNLKTAVLFGETTIDIYSFDEFPQYLINQDGSIVPFTEYEEPCINMMYSCGKILQTIRDKIEAFFLMLRDKLQEMLASA